MSGSDTQMRARLRRLSAALRGDVSTAERAAERWKARADARGVRISELERTISALEQRLQQSQARASLVEERLRDRRYSAPSVRVVRQILAARRQQLPVSAFERAAAEAREVHLRALSPEYVAALENDGTNPALEKVTVEGFDWWIPLDPRVSDRIERASHHGLPMRAILQTREVGLGGVMLDLGANLGRTSIPRVLLGDARAVYAAEPFPPNYAALVRNIEHYGVRGFVVPDQVAIGEARGTVKLRVSRFPGGHRVLRRTRRPVETVDVPVWSVDEWIVRMGIDPGAVTFVKVDTQGSEVGVLRGATSLIGRSHVAWQIETDPKLLKRMGSSLRELIKLIEARFSHFIDLGGPRLGPRGQPIRELREALGRLATPGVKTDLLLYHGSE